MIRLAVLASVLGVGLRCSGVCEALHARFPNGTEIVPDTAPTPTIGSEGQACTHERKCELDLACTANSRLHAAVTP